MALKKIVNDVFEISKRIKQIDKDYFIVFNIRSNKFEVHNSSQDLNTYCLTSPYEGLDVRLLDYVMKTRICNAEKLFEQIDRDNEKIEKECNDRINDMNRIKLGEIYQYAKLGSREFDDKKSYKNNWI